MWRRASFILRHLDVHRLGWGVDMVDAVSVMAEFRQSRILGLLPETFSGGITSNYTYTDGRLTSYPQNEATTTVAYDASSGSGDDSLTGGSGADVLDGGSGVDSIDGGSGSDTCELEPTRVDCEKDVTASSDPGEGGAPDETVIGRVYDGDGLLTTINVTHPDLTVDSYQLTWDRTLPVPQIVSFTNNGVSTTLVYGVNRAFGVGSTGTATSFEYSVLGDTTAGPLTVSSGFDPYGQPDTPNTTTVGFGYRGELHVGDSVYLRFRNLDPGLGRFTAVDPIEGVPGTTTVTNQYAYAGNDPVAMVDPLGLRPGDREIFRFGVSGGGFAGFEDLGVLEIAGFIQERVSDVIVPVPLLPGIFVPVTVGVYRGDDRDFADGPIPRDASRFFVRVDFEFGEGFIQVNETVSADGQTFPPWPIVFNAGSNGEVPSNLFQTTNYFSLSRSADGSAMRVSWSVVHGDRRLWAGPLPTALQRPSFDGSLTVRRLSEETVRVTYRGDCFPSVEAQLLDQNGGRTQVMEFSERDPLFGLAFLPDCTREETRQLP